MADRYDPDGRFTLHPLTGEQVLRRVLDADEDSDERCEPELVEDEDS